MEKHSQGPEIDKAIEQVLGYLNFSSGLSDPAFERNLNQLWAWASDDNEQPAWQTVGKLLRDELGQLTRENASFADATQAEFVLTAVCDHILPGYLDFHQDVLFHQHDAVLFNPFLFAQVCQTALQQERPEQITPEFVQQVIARLNDFIGFRPVAVLSSKKIEPYAHEWVRPVPLYLRGAGVVTGRYQKVVEQALELLGNTDADLLREACFDPKMLDELAFDPRAYDFDHPANKRPNHHFGMWDPHKIDNNGRYRRFVVQQVTLDALMQRVEEPPDLHPDEVLFEAAAVLAGTILMSTGVCGAGPDMHTSDVTLSTLLPEIAKYRDVFYERLIETTEDPHHSRLRAEETEMRQPFAKARQHLNSQLARRRASQLEHVQLAKIFARMGYPEAAAAEALIVPTVSARILCQIDCKLTATDHVLDREEVAEAVKLLAEVVESLHCGIQCGAIIDPWNLLGFDAQFSLFPALENSVHDHRADDLVDLMEEIFVLYARAWSLAAKGDDQALRAKLESEFQQLTDWWYQYAAHEVMQVDAVDATVTFHAAEHVARAIQLWHADGAAAGAIGFWQPHAEMFESPRGYALVIEALFEQSDYVASMGLLVHWLDDASNVGLEQAGNSFHRLIERWLVEVRETNGHAEGGIDLPTWKRIQTSFDYLEANADTLWEVPSFELGRVSKKTVDDEPLVAPGEDDADESDADDLYGAAYADVVYRDSTDDGIEGELIGDAEPFSADELVQESRRLDDHLAFQSTLARLWRIAALTRVHDDVETNQIRGEVLRRWTRCAAKNRTELTRLLDDVAAYDIPMPMGDHDSMLEYDRRRVVKESLLERIIETCVEMAVASRLLAAAGVAEHPESCPLEETTSEAAHSEGEQLEEQLVVATFAAILSRDVEELRRRTTELIEVIADAPLLYVPLGKGGHPQTIVSVRVRQRSIQDLQNCLPRLGLIVEACRIMEMARAMERNNPVGPGAVTEFDELFKIGYKALVECLVGSAESWDGVNDEDHPANAQLVARLEQLTEALLVNWLAHSRTLRLSVMEKVNEKQGWKRLVSFIERYGSDLFTQRFLNLGNVRAILHQGAESWLTQVKQDRPLGFDFRLLDDLDGPISLDEAASHLMLVLEAIVENYGEYRDYNSTTTQSDRGELVYTLLDFLRLRARYDRVCWNLKPVILAHQILVRKGHHRAAQMWRRALRERISVEADKYERKLTELQRKYAMQMSSITDRISERFVRALTIDRVCALVEPAMKEARHGQKGESFVTLGHETEFLTLVPSGVGFDVPAWLVALEDEVERVRLPHWERDDYDELSLSVPQIRLTNDEIQAKLDEWSEQ
jgi:hypothetical protein